MKNRNVIIGLIVALILTASLWIVNRGGEEMQEVQEVQEVQESTSEKIEQEETTDENIPAEFQDNLDDAFEDLDAVDL